MSETKSCQINQLQHNSIAWLRARVHKLFQNKAINCGLESQIRA